MTNAGRHLPVVQSDLDEGEPSCSPKIYVSNEEAALLAAMRDLRDRSAKLKKEMRNAEPERRSRLESEVEEMRTEWKDLSAQREKAFVRKMIMLGHLPPNHSKE
jgi:predicted nuclease with TOPRIM domain